MARGRHSLKLERGLDMGAGGWQVVAGLVAIAGLLFTIGGFIWGHGKGAGKNAQRWEQTTKVLQAFQDDFEALQDSLTNCQTASASNQASTKEKMENNKGDVKALQDDVKNLTGALHKHEASQDVHTNQEWRTSTIARMEMVFQNVDKRLSSFESNMGGRIGSLENKINGFFNSGNKTGKEKQSET